MHFSFSRAFVQIQLAEHGMLAFFIDGRTPVADLVPRIERATSETDVCLTNNVSLFPHHLLGAAVRIVHPREANRGSLAINRVLWPGCRVSASVPVTPVFCLVLLLLSA